VAPAARGRCGVKSTAALTKIADRLWSEVIRGRDPVCVWCRRRPSRQAHHVFGRRARSTRWALDNGVGICFGCHLKGHENPLDFHEHIRERIGPDKYDKLRITSKMAMKVDVQMIIFYLREYAKERKIKTTN
jgi:hypothetical protein